MCALNMQTCSCAPMTRKIFPFLKNIDKEENQLWRKDLSYHYRFTSDETCIDLHELYYLY